MVSVVKQVQETVRAGPSRVARFRAPDEGCLDQAKGRSIGFEFARFGMKLPEDSADAIRAGFQEGLHRFGHNHIRSTRWERKLVRLRLSAWKRNRVVDESVTAEYLEKIAVERCPITRDVMTTGTGTGSDATVDRVFNGGGYAVGNIAMMSMRANVAKANLMPIEIVEIANSQTAPDGLSELEWVRLACLVCAATPPGYPQQHVPMVVFPPDGLMISNGYTLLQQTFSLICIGLVGRKSSSEVREEIRGKKHKRSYDEMISILSAVAARRLRGVTGQEERRFALGDCWAEKPVFDAYHAFIKGVDHETIERMVTAAIRVSQTTTSFHEEDLKGWRLESRGYER